MRGAELARELNGDIRRAVSESHILINFDHITGCLQPFSLVPAGTKRHAVVLMQAALSSRARYLTMLQCIAHIRLEHRGYLIPRSIGGQWRSTCPLDAEEDDFMDGWLDWVVDNQTSIQQLQQPARVKHRA